MSEWQPIETAPKDGTEFLAYLSNGWIVKLHAGSSIINGDRYAWWQGSHQSIPYVPSHPKETSWKEHYINIATHWMPLPEPPQR